VNKFVELVVVVVVVVEPVIKVDSNESQLPTGFSANFVLFVVSNQSRLERVVELTKLGFVAVAAALALSGGFVWLRVGLLFF